MMRAVEGAVEGGGEQHPVVAEAAQLDGVGYGLSGCGLVRRACGGRGGGG